MTDTIHEEAPQAGHGKLQWRIAMGFLAGLVAGLLTYGFARDAAWVSRDLAKLKSLLAG